MVLGLVDIIWGKIGVIFRVVCMIMNGDVFESKAQWYLGDYAQPGPITCHGCGVREVDDGCPEARFDLNYWLM